jgi:hypothetical protein
VLLHFLESGRFHTSDSKGFSDNSYLTIILHTSDNSPSSCVYVPVSWGSMKWESFTSIVFAKHKLNDLVKLKFQLISTLALATTGPKNAL